MHDRISKLLISSEEREIESSERTDLSRRSEQLRKRKKISERDRYVSTDSSSMLLGYINSACLDAVG